MLVSNNCVFALETPEADLISSRDCFLKGWAFPQNCADEFQLFVRVNSLEVQATLGFPRPDVARHFADPSRSDCGFVLRFRRPKGRHICLSARINGVEVTLADQIPVTNRIRTSEKPEHPSYENWLNAKEAELFWPEKEIPGRLARLPYKPQISILLPTYNSPPYFLRRCLESVLDQSYTNWQLCIADDLSPDPRVLETLERYSSVDQRFVVQRCRNQGGISAATNFALGSATGDYIVLLDHDDELHPAALLELVRSLNTGTDYDLLYSDEDKINEWGVRGHPAFKPDFDRDVFLSFNYLGHLVALKTSLVKELGGLRSSCDGAQDWDLLIRASEMIDARRIKHIRKPLYHWRMHSGSTAQDLDAKPYVTKAWHRVLKDHVARTNTRAEVAGGLFHGSMRLKHSAPKAVESAVFVRAEDGMFQTSVIRMNAGGRLLRCYQVGEGSVMEVDTGEKNFAAAASNGHTRREKESIPRRLYSLTELEAEVLVFINAPLESVNHLFFEELIGQARRSDCGLVTGISLDSANKTIATGLVHTGQEELQDPYAGIPYPGHGYMGQLSVVRSVDACSETFFATRREHVAAIGGFGMISSGRMASFVAMLGKNAREKNLSVLFTPYAVATFSSHPRLLNADAPEPLGPGVARLNPRLLEFDEPERLLQGTS